MTDGYREILAERCENAAARIREIGGEKTVPEPFRDYFARTASFLMSVRKDADNRALYEDILPENYRTSYGNPDYAAEKLGAGYGPLLSAVYAELRGIIPAVFEDDMEGQAVLMELFLSLYFEFENEKVPQPSTVKHLFSMYLRDYTPLFVREEISRMLLPERSFAADIIRDADFSRTDYLYRFGEYVTEETLKTAAFVNSLPEETVRKMADTFTEGYRRGFELGGKDLGRKETVHIIYELGYDRVIAAAIENFKQIGLRPVISRTPVRLVTKSPNRHAGYTGAVPNEQFDYDHREDLALILDEEYVSLRKRAAQEAYESLRREARLYAGPAVMETFGREPFVPGYSEHAVRMNDRETKRHLDLRNALLMIRQRYIPEEERSFTIIDFPVPAVGPDFEEIFRETIRVNTLDQEVYREIQQRMIDALDRGTAVHVTGRNGNETDLMIALHELGNPAGETNFENCLADVNIPVGEVFTSPVLAGTNGLLHVRRVFLEGFEYRDLRITLKDGMTDTYSCGNFEDPAKGKRYIEENILFHHPSLAIGEFAVGTNTAAYVMAKRYGIEALMPILIAEKTGPHFALGDTCYSREEDRAVFNPDGKEVIARDNEHTLVRKTDPSKAYYGCHTDITIPYNELGAVCVIHGDGTETYLIRDGRFVLPGTEALNEPLDNDNEHS